MRGTVYIKIILATMIALSMTFAMVACAGATTPAQPMSAHLWVDGLPQGELILVTVANHTQLNYVGGQGRYDFTIAGQPGEIIRVTVGGKEVRSFTYEPGAPAYLSLAYSSGNVTASTYQPGDPMPTPHAVPTIAPEPVTERTGVSLNGTWVVLIAFTMAIVAVGCAMTLRRKTK
jgi:hypothetical protein